MCDNPDTEEGKFYLQVLLSVTEYQNFIDMMKHYKKEQANKE